MEQIQLSGCAIIEDGKLLLLWRKKHGHYEFPGGKVKSGESLERAAARETKEEIGCDVEIEKYIGYENFYIDNRDFRSHKYLAKIKNGHAPRVMEEELFGEIFWLPIKEYKKYAVAPNVKNFCEKYIQDKLEE